MTWSTVEASPKRVADEVCEAVERRRNILVSGGTGTGKTTLLAAIARLVPADERIVTIEDTVELQLDHPNLIRFEARRQTDGSIGRHRTGLG